MSSRDAGGDGATVPPTIEQLRHLAEMLATPIDFDQLVADGILRKRGAWWEVLDWNRLPEHARQKVQAVMTGNRVQFCAHAPGIRGRLE